MTKRTLGAFEKSMVPDFVHSGMGIGPISTFFLPAILEPARHCNLTLNLCANWLTYITKNVLFKP